MTSVVAATSGAATVKAAVTGDLPKVTLSLIQYSNNQTIPLKNISLTGLVWVRASVATANAKIPANLITELGVNFVDSNGVIFKLTYLNAAGTICTTACTMMGILDFTAFRNMTGTIYAYAKVAGGVTGKDGEYPAKVANIVKQPPAVSITSPANNSTVSGNISVGFNAIDNVALTSISLYIDSKLVYSGKNSPQVYALDTKSLSNGSHSLYATAYNTNGLGASSGLVNFTVNNPVEVTGTIVPSIVSGMNPSLVLNDINARDTVFIAQSGNNIMVSTDAVKWTTHNGPFNSVTYKGNSGIHNVSVLSSVQIESLVYCAAGCTITAQGSARNTVVTLDAVVPHGTTVVNGNANTSAWVQNSDTVNGVSSNRLHRLASLPAPAADPSDLNYYGAAVSRSSYPLWGNVSMNDINQGAIGDCYFLAPLASFAGGAIPNTNPVVRVGNLDQLKEQAVELADGNVLTQWKNKSAANAFSFIVVTKKLAPYYATTSPSYGWASKGIWVPVLEKAFALYRSGQNSYKSIQGGYIWEDVEAFGFAHNWDYNSGLWMNSKTSKTQPQATWRAGITTSLTTKQVVSLGSWQATYPTNSPRYVSANSSVIGGHAYSFLWVRQVGNQFIYTVRNPWGFDPSGGVGGGVLELSEAAFMAGYGWDDYSLNLPTK